jgi:hypothetical protein
VTERPTKGGKGNDMKTRKAMKDKINECEIFTFPTDSDRQAFISDLRAFDSEIAFATNMDPEVTEPERYLVAIPTRFYDWVTKEGDAS